MRRNLITVLGVAALAAAAIGATAVFGSNSEPTGQATYRHVNVSMAPSAPAARAAAAKKAGLKVVYLSGSGQVDAGPSNPALDFGLKASKQLCPSVLDGGIQADNLDFFQQGSYVKKGRYHVLMSLDDAAAATPVTIHYSLHLICLKGKV
jgi:hypothetical protein